MNSYELSYADAHGERILTVKYGDGGVLLMRGKVESVPANTRKVGGLGKCNAEIKVLGGTAFQFLKVTDDRGESFTCSGEFPPIINKP